MSYRDDSFHYQDADAYDRRSKREVEGYLHSLWWPILTGYLWQAIKPGDTVADLGAGTFIHILRMDKAEKIYAVEISNEMIAVGRKRVESMGDKVVVIKKPAVSTDIPDGSCDVVWSIGLTEYIEDLPKLLGEINRIVKPGGRAYIQFPNKNSLYNQAVTWGGKFLHQPIKIFRSWNEFKKVVRSAGFRVVSVESRGVFPYMPNIVMRYTSWLWRTLDRLHKSLSSRWLIGINDFCVLEKPSA